MNLTSTHLRIPVLSALVVRCVLICIPLWLGRSTTDFVLPDSASYLNTAYNLATKAAFFSQSGQAEFFRTPGYPLLLVPGYWLGIPYGWALVLQILLSCGVVWLVGYWASRLFGQRAGLFASWLLVFDPLNLAMSMVIMSDVFYLFLLLAGAYLLNTSQGLQLRRWLGAGFLIGFSIWVRPVGMYLPPLLMIARFLQEKSFPDRMIWRGSILFLTISLLFPAVWIARNVSWSYHGFSSSGEVLSACYVKPAIEAKARGLDYYGLRDSLGCNQGNHLPQWSCSLLQMAVDYPKETLIVFSSGVVRGMFDPGTMDVARVLGIYPMHGGLMNDLIQNGFWSALIKLWNYSPLAALILLLPLAWMPLLLVLGCVSCFQIIMRRSISLRFLAVPACLLIYFLFFCAGPGSVGRYRLPVLAVWVLLISALRGGFKSHLQIPVHGCGKTEDH